MNREVSTYVYKLDVKTILDNYDKKSFWQKSWTIYKAKDYQIKLSIAEILIQRNQITFKVFPEMINSCYKLRRTNKKACLSSWDYAVLNIPIRDDYTQIKFENDLVCACQRVIDGLENRLIAQYSEFQLASELDDAETNIAHEQAENFLNEHNITNKDIREAYIEAYVSKVATCDHSLNCLMSMKHTIIPSESLRMAGFIFSDREMYDKYAEKFKKVRPNNRIKLWLRSQEIQSEEYVKSLKDQLEEI